MSLFSWPWFLRRKRPFEDHSVVSKVDVIQRACLGLHRHRVATEVVMDVQVDELSDKRGSFRLSRVASLSHNGWTIEQSGHAEPNVLKRHGQVIDLMLSKPNERRLIRALRRDFDGIIRLSELLESRAARKQAQALAERAGIDSARLRALIGRAA